MIIKKVLIFGLLLSSTFSYSQNSSIAQFPDSKNIMLEINFNPFGSDEIFNFDYLQTKYWINDKTALRLGVQFDYKNNNSKAEGDYESNEGPKSTISEKSFLIGFKPGIEFRILEKSKVSPYWGVEFLYINKSSKSEYVDYNRDYNGDDYVYNKVETKLDGAWKEVSFQELESIGQWGGSSYITYSTTDYSKERAFSSYGSNLILGTDFFLIPNLYFGYEIGLGYEMTNYKQIDLERMDKKLTYPSSKSTDFGFRYNNSIRLGFYF